MNRLFQQMRSTAKKRKIEFGLTRGEVETLTKQVCHYCGQEPAQVMHSGESRRGDYTYNGLDRMDNHRGYVSDNVVSCCGQCNWAKGKMSYDEYINLIKRSYNYLTR